MNRDVIFMATADEEASGFYGERWLLENLPEIFEGAGYFIDEGGCDILLNDSPMFNIEVTQNIPLWLRLNLWSWQSTVRDERSKKNYSGPLP